MIMRYATSLITFASTILLFLLLCVDVSDAKEFVCSAYFRKYFYSHTWRGDYDYQLGDAIATTCKMEGVAYGDACWYPDYYCSMKVIESDDDDDDDADMLHELAQSYSTATDALVDNADRYYMHPTKQNDRFLLPSRCDDFVKGRSPCDSANIYFYECFVNDSICVHEEAAQSVLGRLRTNIDTDDGGIWLPRQAIRYVEAGSYELVYDEVRNITTKITTEEAEQRYMHFLVEGETVAVTVGVSTAFYNRSFQAQVYARSWFIDKKIDGLKFDFSLPMDGFSIDDNDKEHFYLRMNITVPRNIYHASSPDDNDDFQRYYAVFETTDNVEPKLVARCSPRSGLEETCVEDFYIFTSFPSNLGSIFSYRESSGAGGDEEASSDASTTLLVVVAVAACCLGAVVSAIVVVVITKMFVVNSRGAQVSKLPRVSESGSASLRYHTSRGIRRNNSRVSRASYASRPFV